MIIHCENGNRVHLRLRPYPLLDIYFEGEDDLGYTIYARNMTDFREEMVKLRGSLIEELGQHPTSVIFKILSL